MISSIVCLIWCIPSFKLINLLTKKDTFQTENFIIRVNLGISMNKVTFREGKRKFEHRKICEETCGERVEGTTKHYMDNCPLFFAERIELESTMSLIYPESWLLRCLQATAMSANVAQNRSKGSLRSEEAWLITVSVKNIMREMRQKFSSS